MKLQNKVILLLLAVTGAFVYIGNAIPQIKSGPAKKDRKVGGTPQELVTQGKEIFEGLEAGCLVCHSLNGAGGNRCPELAGIGNRSKKRGGAEYLVESLYDPDAVIVDGTNQSLMKPVNLPPISLGHDEILAVVSYLNSLGGKTDEDFLKKARDTQKPWREGKRKPTEAGGGKKKAKLPILKGDAKRGEEIFRKQKCIQCHQAASFKPTEKDAAPDLRSIGSAQGPDYILESILKPNAQIVAGYSFINVYYLEEDENGEEIEVPEDIMEARALKMEWVPGKENPGHLLLDVRYKNGKTESLKIDLSLVSHVGNTQASVLMTVDGEEDFFDIAGDFVSGDAATGLTLKLLEKGEWVEKSFKPGEIQPRSVLMPSPMRADFGDEMTPREVYDLVSFLSGQKGE